MTPTRHPSNTRVLNAPLNWNHDQLPVDALPITDHTLDGVPCVASFWQPDAAELSALASGGLVMLTVLGSNMPPVSLAVTVPEQAQHPDDDAVDLFAAAMKAKLAKQRERGYSGWDQPEACPAERLQQMLVGHIAKGDPVDVGNFAMMLWNRGEPTNTPQPSPTLADDTFADKAIAQMSIALADTPAGNLTNAVQLLVRPIDVRGDESGAHPGESFVMATITREEVRAMQTALDADWADHLLCTQPKATEVEPS